MTVLAVSFASIAAGISHTCGVTPNEAVYCWGLNSSAALGDGTVVDRLTPVPIYGDLRASVAATGGHTCVISLDGTTYCWGAGQSGQLGDGSVRVGSAAPVAIGGGLAFESVTAGRRHTCGLTADGTAYCWGENLYGQLGNDSAIDCFGTPCSTLPEAVSGGITFSSLTAGGLHSCGVATDSTAYCWGFNNTGQLGDGTNVDRSFPATVLGSLKFKSLSAGGDHTCGVTVDGAGYCWGWGNALGSGSPVDANVPVPVSGGYSFALIAAGGGHSCGLTAGGETYCWGDFKGTNAWYMSPVLLAGGLTFRALSAGHQHTCGITVDGASYCWGGNPAGQLGDGSYESRPDPTSVFGSTGSGP